MRVAVCFALVIFFSVFAYRRWFVSLCAALVLMAVLQHPDMPRSILGIQGMNPWNLLIGNVVIAWLMEKRQAGRTLGIPGHVVGAMLLFIAVIMWATLRLLISPGILAKEEPPGFMISEYVINTVKWLIPGILLFDACRTRKRTYWALASIMLIYFLLGVQVVRWVPIGMADSGGELAYKASKLIQNEIGYNRVTLSMMLAGASWAVLCAMLLMPTWKKKVGLLIVFGTIFFAQALTGGRTGYVAWFVLGLMLSFFRWRKLLILIPIAVVLVFAFVPAVRERLLFGIAADKHGSELNEYELTSGRNIAWPMVLDGIKKQPIMGYGRRAMVTTGIRDILWEDYGEEFPHPHNAYLEALLDSGIIGLLASLYVFGSILRPSYRLFKDRSDPLVSAVGGMCFSLIMALLLGSFGGQTFYPREGAVGMWAAVGLMFRIWVQWKDANESGTALFADENVLEVVDDESPEPILVS